MSFKTFFKQRTIRFMIGIFAALLIISNVVVYGSSTIQYQREHERQLQGYKDMMSHLLTMEDQATAITYTMHYYHTQGIRISFFDESKNLIYQTDQGPETSDLIPIVDDDEQTIAYIKYDEQFSLFGRELTTALIIINGLSIILFFSAIRLLYWYINKAYKLLEDDLNHLGQSDNDFYFSDLEDVSIRLWHLIQSEKKIRDDQKEYVKVLAHDIKTPLTVLKAYIEGLELKRIELDEKAIKDMKDEINHMESLMPRLIKQRQDEHHETQDIKSFIDQTIKRYLELFKSKDIRIEKDVDQLQIHMDYMDMKRMIENLLDNAFHYSYPHQSIEVSLKENKLVIKDQGIGMSQEQISKLKRGPFRSKEAKHLYKEGSGMGLQIVQDIVKKYGFKIDFESQENQGLKVIIFFK
jgi:signal transduction histidine kinase